MPAAQPIVATPGSVAPAVATPAADLTKSGPDASKAAKTALAKDVPKDVLSDAAKATLKLADQGTVRLRIDPWGVVFVNGRSIGISPPLKEIKLAPGKYKIEVKNTTFTPYLANIEVKAKEDVGVKYKFQ